MKKKKKKVDHDLKFLKNKNQVSLVDKLNDAEK